jgi:hypothetical protein
MNVIIKREWKNREIITEICVDKKGIEIVMTLDEFVNHVVAEVRGNALMPKVAAKPKTIFGWLKGAETSSPIDFDAIVENAIRTAATATVESAKKNTEKVA